MRRAAYGVSMVLHEPRPEGALDSRSGGSVRRFSPAAHRVARFTGQGTPFRSHISCKHA